MEGVAGMVYVTIDLFFAEWLSGGPSSSKINYSVLRWRWELLRLRAW